MNYTNTLASLQNITLDFIGNRFKISEEIIQQLPVLNHIKISLKYSPINILTDLKNRSIKMNKQYTIATSIELTHHTKKHYNHPHDEIFKKNGFAELKKNSKIKPGTFMFATHYCNIGCFATQLYNYFLNENIDINFRIPVLSEVIKTYNSSIDQIVNIAEILLPFIYLCIDFDKTDLTTKQKIIIAKQILEKIKKLELDYFSIYKCLQQIDVIEKTTSNITAEQILAILNIQPTLPS